MTIQMTIQKKIVAMGAVLVVAAASAMIGAFGGVSNAGAQEVPKRGGKLVVRLIRGIGGFDHVKVPVAGRSRQSVLFTMTDKLFEFDEKTGKSIPVLGLSHKSTNNNKVWRIKLRQGVRFSNGELLTAKAYESHWTRLLQSRLAPNYRRNLGGDLRAVKAVEKFTIEFTFGRPFPGFPAAMAAPRYIWYMNAPAFEKRNKDKPDYNRMTAGLGPYILKEWITGSRVIVVRNPNYWNPARQHLDEIEFRIMPGRANSIINSMLSGDVDVMVDFGSAIGRGRKLAKQGKLIIKEGWRKSIAPLVNFRTSQAPFDDVRIRRAVAHALNRPAMVKVLTRGTGSVATESFPPQSRWHCGGIKYPEYDPAKAKALIKAYGKPVKFILHSASLPPFKKMALIVLQQLKVVGFDVDLKIGPRSPVPLLANVRNDKVKAWVMPGITLYDAHNDELSLRSGSRGNLWRMNSPSIDAAIRKLVRAKGFAARKAALCEFQQVKAEELPFVLSYNSQAAVLMRPHVRGLPNPTDGIQDFDNAWLAR